MWARFTSCFGRKPVTELKDVVSDSSPSLRPTEVSPLIVSTPPSPEVVELSECLQLLKDGLAADRKKVVQSYLLDIRLALALVSASGFVASLATYPFSSSATDTSREQEELKAKIANTSSTINASLANVYCSIDPAEFICMWLRFRFNDISFFWTHQWTPKKELSGTCAKAHIDDTWGGRYEYVTKQYPAFRGADYCSLMETDYPFAYPFHELGDCYDNLDLLCFLGKDIKWLLNYTTSPAKADYSAIFSLQQQYSQAFAQLNYAEAQADHSGNGLFDFLRASVMFVSGVATLSFSVLYLFCCRALKNCNNDLKNVDYINTTANDDLLFGRIAALRTKYKIPSHITQTSELIQHFEIHLNTAKARSKPGLFIPELNLDEDSGSEKQERKALDLGNA